jgi:predicted dehydrogenase
MARALEVAFIGAGTVAALHAAAVDATSGAHLAGLYDPQEDAARRLVQIHGGHLYPSLDDLLSDPTVQAVAVLSPLESHHTHAAAVLHAGKHVLIEKPVAATRAELEDLQSVAAATNLVCMPAHNYIYLPAMRQIRRCIDSGAFGTITSAWIVYNLHHPTDVARKYPGVLRQIITHHFYSLLYLLGRPSALTALAAEIRPAGQRLDREDQVAILLQMESGALVNLFASFAADDQTSDPWTVLFKILGTHGGGVYNWRDSVILNGGAGLAWRYPAYEESFVHEWHYFVHEAINQGQLPLSTLDDAIVAQSLIEAAEQSIATKRTIPLHI